ncbi:DUF3011 domain-containing protein [Pseudoxanthomonas sacheonensis]|uniref:DUF3011 domain-containing protein n=1 Tax=Pseudoxanthomonas sacheonensis TaxID=443615 RepID=UPI001FE669AB|nr:DUF3011 domain-containing protein [Pseudoxanthomonas sacheonensis]
MNIVLKSCLVSLLVCQAHALAEPPSPAAGGMRFRCESDRTQQHYCQVDTTEGITLVKQLSKIPCMQGRNWDYDRHGVWVSHRCRAEFVAGKLVPVQEEARGALVRCESLANRVEHCPADTGHGVRLTRLLSTSDCVENLDWGYDETGIWTARGCRAEFRVGFADVPAGPVDARSKKLVCASDDKQRKRCEVTVDNGVDLLRQLSRTRCVKEANWGWDRAGIWVDKGCRAEFGVH